MLGVACPLWSGAADTNGLDWPVAFHTSGCGGWGHGLFRRAIKARISFGQFGHSLPPRGRISEILELTLAIRRGSISPAAPSAVGAFRAVPELICDLGLLQLLRKVHRHGGALQPLGFQ